MRHAVYLAATALVLTQGSTVSANGGGGTGAPSLVPMKEIIVPIVDGARAYGRLRVKLVLLAHDAAAMHPIETNMPKLRETAVAATAEFARLYASPFTPVDAERLTKDIFSALAAQNADHAISRILVVQVMAEQN